MNIDYLDPLNPLTEHAKLSLTRCYRLVMGKNDIEHEIFCHFC